jgi:hypothetical protein
MDEDVCAKNKTLLFIYNVCVTLIEWFAVCNVPEDIHPILTGQRKFIIKLIHEYGIDVNVCILKVKVRCPIITHYNNISLQEHKTMHIFM